MRYGAMNFPVRPVLQELKEIADSLKNIGYDDTVTFEIFSRDRNYLRISRKRFASMLETRIKTQPRN